MSPTAVKTTFEALRSQLARRKARMTSLTSPSAMYSLIREALTAAADGRVLETSAFSELTLGVKAKPESVNAALKQLDGWRVLKTIFRERFKAQPLT